MGISDIPRALFSRLWPEAASGGGAAVLQPGWITYFQDMSRKYAQYYHYYSGDVLNQPNNPKKPDAGLKYPLRLNMCRQWSHMMASYIWGEYKESVVTWKVERKRQESGNIAELEEKRASSMEEVLRLAWEEQGNDARADTASIDLMIYGGMVPKVYWDIVDKKIRTDWLPPTYFAPRWHPMDVTRLQETYVIFDISREDARDIFSIDITGMPPDVRLVERWTDKKFEITVEGQDVRKSSDNPMGFIPHVYIPRLRGADNYGYFGLSVMADTMSIQDEVNLRAADIGDGIAYSSHPIRWVVNYTGSDNLEVGADALWNLGISMGGREPKAGTLDVKTNYDQAMQYVKEVERFGRGSASLPAIAFGEDEGSQRSSLTLLVRYLPLTQEVNRERLHLKGGLKDWARKTLKLAARFGQYGASYEEEDVDERIINPTLAPILPESVEDIVSQWNIRISGGFGTPEQAYRALGHPEPEMAAEEALEYAEKIARAESITKGVWNGNGGTGGTSPKGSDDSNSQSSKLRKGTTGSKGQQNQSPGTKSSQAGK